MTFMDLATRSAAPVAACVLALALTSCFEQDEPEAIDTSPTGTAVVKSDSSGPSFVATPTAFEGTWTSGCSGEGTVERFVFSGNIYQARLIAFDDAHCSTGETVTSNEIGHFEIGPELVTSGGVKASPVSFEDASGVSYRRLMFVGSNGLYFGRIGSSDGSAMVDFDQPFFQNH